eukprot:1116262-Rhodomonas_salina.3
MRAARDLTQHALVVGSAIRLRVRYAMPGTGVAYSATSGALCDARTNEASSALCDAPVWTWRMVLPAGRYDMYRY